jgi:penicillin G amidase
MLANDPHLGIRNPSIWYEIGLQAPGWNVDGVTFPGVPGVVVGHNDRIAWGVTNVGGDTQDLYIEKLNPANPHQYEFQGAWQELQVVPEEIKIKGKPSVTIEVRITRHGPIMNDVSKSMEGSQPMALQWTALKNAPLIGSVLQYNRAKNWNEFRAALRGFSSPAQNFVYADVDGNIGYQIPGLWPLRAKGDGLLPVPGWTGEYEWTGYASFDELPSVYNPPANFVATANNRPVPANFSQKFSLGEEFDPGWRAARITQLLTAEDKLSIQDLTAIQNDVVSLPGREIGTYLANLSDSDPKTGAAVKRLKNWDGQMTADSVPAALYKVATQFAFEDMFKEKLGTAYNNYLDESRFYLPLLLTLLKDPANEWWGTGGRDALLQESLGQAVDSLNSRFGGNLDDWKWGKLHTLSFSHTPLGPALPFPLTLVLNQKTLERAGDGQTVAAASYDYVDSGFSQTSGQSFRTVMSLANFDDSLIVNTLGQSGQPFSKHWGDNIDDWNGGRYHAFLFSSDEVKSKTEATLTLRP